MKKRTSVKMIRVMVVDDHPIVREGLKSRIEQQEDMLVCHEAERLGQAILYIEREPVDLAIIDISLKGRNGIELIKQIRRMGFTFPILVLSIHEESTYLQRSMEAGAQGYLLKDEAPWQIIRAIRNLSNGKLYVSKKMLQKLITILALPKNRDRGIEKLSDRELEVLEATGKGMTTRQIAQVLNLSISTIETHKNRIKSKLKLENAAQLAVLATNWMNESKDGL